MNTIEFEVHNQTLIRVDSKGLINRNKHVYKATFTFDEDSEWIELNKFVIFTDGWGNTTTQHLGRNSTVASCLIPDKVLSGSYFKVSVYAGDLITTNRLTISLIQSGYHRSPPIPPHHHHHHHSGGREYTGKDIFVEIFDQLEASVDSIIYDNKTLYLFNRDRVLDSIYLPFLTDNEIVELVTNLTSDFITNIPLASDTEDGLLSSEDKVKLDNIEEGANRTVVDDELNSSSDNPVSNRTVTSSFSDLDSRLVDLDENMGTGLDTVNNSIMEHSNHLNELDESLETIRANLDGKEDSYDYVERLDNVIISLINHNE